jgi:DNA-binding NarL/FixJ family response regulator
MEDGQQPLDAGSDHPETLTARQREIVQMVAEGQSSKQIGLRLGLSHRTVETHRANAMRLLGINKQTELVRYVLTHLSLESIPAGAPARQTGEKN